MQISEYIPAATTIFNLLDIALVFLLVYVVLKLLRGTRAVPTAIGILVLALIYWFALSQELSTFEYVLRSAAQFIGIAIIVLFQSEIRQALIYFGARLRLPVRRQRGQRGATVYDEIVLAVTTLATDKVGALIVLERAVGLRNLVDAGVSLDAKISYDLLVSIFQTATPLHDGAVVIQNERIAAASVFLPLTKNPSVSRDLGTRHRAAIGVTEGTDAVSIVVSEETGLITFVENGEMRRFLDATQLRNLLLEAMGVQVPDESAAKQETEKEAESVARG